MMASGWMFAISVFQLDLLLGYHSIAAVSQCTKAHIVMNTIKHEKYFLGLLQSTVTTPYNPGDLIWF